MFQIIPQSSSLSHVSLEFKKFSQHSDKCVYCGQEECFGHVSKMVLPYAIIDPLKVEYLNGILAKICIECGVAGSHEGDHYVKHAKFMRDINEFKIFVPKRPDIKQTMSPSELIMEYSNVRVYELITSCLLTFIIVPPLSVIARSARGLMYNYNSIQSSKSSKDVFKIVSAIYNYMHKLQTEYIREHVHKRVSEIYRAVIFCLDGEDDYGIVKISHWLSERLFVTVHIQNASEVTKYKELSGTEAVMVNGRYACSPEFDLQIGDVVSRQVKNGDTVIINRQPSLDIHAMVALTVKIDETGTDYKSVGISPIVVSVLKGDFDGDAVAIMFPPEHLMQKVYDRMHVYNINYCVPVQNTKVLVKNMPDTKMVLRELSSQEDKLMWELLVQKSVKSVRDIMEMFVDAKAKGAPSDMKEIFDHVGDLHVLPSGVCPYIELKDKKVIPCDRSYNMGMTKSFFIAHLMEQYLKLQSSSDKKVADTGYFTKKLVLLLSHLRVVDNNGRIETSRGDLVCETSSFKRGDAAGEMVATTLGAMLTQEFLESKRSDRGNILETEKLLRKITRMLSLSKSSDGELIITNVTDINEFQRKYKCTLWSKYLQWISYECTPELRKKRTSSHITVKFRILEEKMPSCVPFVKPEHIKIHDNIMECTVDCDERDIWNLVHEFLQTPISNYMFIDNVLDYSGTTLHVSFNPKNFNYLKIREIVPSTHVIYWNNIARLNKMVTNRAFVRESLTVFFNTYYTGNRNAEYIRILINTILPLSGTSFSGCGYNRTKQQNVSNYMTMCLFESIRKSMIHATINSKKPFVDDTIYTDLLIGWLGRNHNQEIHYQDQDVDDDNEVNDDDDDEAENINEEENNDDNNFLY
jgi:hypothetical protein